MPEYNGVGLLPPLDDCHHCYCDDYYADAVSNDDCGKDDDTLELPSLDDRDDGLFVIGCNNDVVVVKSQFC